MMGLSQGEREKKMKLHEHLTNLEHVLYYF
jgi:hypothetical protein